MSQMEKLKIGWRMLRPFTLSASLVPVLIGTAQAFVKGRFNFELFAVFLLACIVIQAATNMFNEYFDYRRGLDTAEMIGISGTIVRDGILPATVLKLACSLIGISVLLGLYICIQTNVWVAVVGSVCILIAYFYSGGPKPLSYTPFGELAASLAMGPVMVLLAYYIQMREVSVQVIAISLPIGLLIGAILLGNNVRDAEQDFKGGRRTLAIVLGSQGGRNLLGILIGSSYLIVLALAATSCVTPWVLLVCLSLPLALRIVRRFFRYSDPIDLHTAVKGTAGLLLVFGFLLVIGLGL